MIEMQCEKWCLLKKGSIGGLYSWVLQESLWLEICNKRIALVFISYSILILFQVKFILLMHRAENCVSDVHNMVWVLLWFSY